VNEASKLLRSVTRPTVRSAKLVLALVAHLPAVTKLRTTVVSLRFVIAKLLAAIMKLALRVVNL
jgi:hypothetical protein